MTSIILRRTNATSTTYAATVLILTLIYLLCSSDILLAVSQMNKQTSTEVMRQSSFSASLIYFIRLSAIFCHPQYHSPRNAAQHQSFLFIFSTILWHIEIAIFQINNDRCMVVSLLWRAACSASTNGNRIIFRQMFGAITAEWTKERRKNGRNCRRIYKCLPSANGWSPI